MSCNFQFDILKGICFRCRTGPVHTLYVICVPSLWKKESKQPFYPFTFLLKLCGKIMKKVLISFDHHVVFFLLFLQKVSPQCWFVAAAGCSVRVSRRSRELFPKSQEREGEKICDWKVSKEKEAWLQVSYWDSQHSYSGHFSKKISHDPIGCLQGFQLGVLFGGFQDLFNPKALK